MTSGLVYILRSLMDLYLLTFALRIAMQWVRADFRNPIVQFVLTVTNPVVLPLRKFIPPYGKIDLAAVVGYLVLLFLFSLILLNIVCMTAPGIGSMFGVAALRGVYLLLSIYLFLVFAYVIMSWITMGGSGYNPSLAAISNLLGALVQPVLAPFRRFIPAIGGFDLSPIALLLVIGALRETILSLATQFSTIGCPVGAVF
jgi:YggT family protein